MEEQEGNQMQNLPKLFNMLVQTWNTIFFALVFFGGVYLCANDHLAIAPISL